jgi:hypothetical protein
MYWDPDTSRNRKEYGKKSGSRGLPRLEFRGRSRAPDHCPFVGSPTALDTIFFVENGRVPKTTFLALRCEGFLRCNILLHINSNHGEIHF